MTVSGVGGARRVDVGPTRRNFELMVSNLQVTQQLRCGLIDAAIQFEKFVELMPVVVGLPSLSGLEFGQGATQVDQPTEDFLVYPLSADHREIRLPNQR